ncbi:MAG: LamG domain-containing protein [Flavobacteriales bacterium]|nr:LamG domain-containing protein [Flavobacteriales bacterium]
MNRALIHFLLCLFILSCCVQESPLWAQNYCLRFFGNGTNDVDRVKFLLDAPSSPLDVGWDFTIEFQMRALLADNPHGVSVSSGPGDDWVLGHIVVDRDVFGPGDFGDFGISLAGGRIAFGVNNGSHSYTLVSNSLVADNQWHHVAVTRNSQNGELRIFIDGQLDASVLTPVTGDVSYRDGRPTSWPNDPYLVLGAEKHDYDPLTYPSFRGFLDELRISSVVRYASTYTPQPYLSDDSSTVGLFHMDEGSGFILHNAASQGAGFDGSIHFGGNPSGPEWVLRESVGLPTEKNPFLNLLIANGYWIVDHVGAPMNFKKLNLMTLSGQTILTLNNVITPVYIPIPNAAPQILLVQLQGLEGIDFLRGLMK